MPEVTRSKNIDVTAKNKWHKIKAQSMLLKAFYLNARSFTRSPASSILQNRYMMMTSVATPQHFYDQGDDWSSTEGTSNKAMVRTRVRIYDS